MNFPPDWVLDRMTGRFEWTWMWGTIAAVVMPVMWAAWSIVSGRPGHVAVIVTAELLALLSLLLVADSARALVNARLERRRRAREQRWENTLDYCSAVGALTPADREWLTSVGWRP